MRLNLFVIVATAISLISGISLPIDTDTNLIPSTDVDADTQIFDGDTSPLYEPPPENPLWISTSQDTPPNQLTQTPDSPSENSPSPPSSSPLSPFSDPLLLLSSNPPCPADASADTHMRMRIRARGNENSCVPRHGSTDLEAARETLFNPCAVVADHTKHLCCQGPPGSRKRMWFGVEWDKIENCQMAMAVCVAYSVCCQDYDGDPISGRAIGKACHMASVAPVN